VCQVTNCILGLGVAEVVVEWNVGSKRVVDGDRGGNRRRAQLILKRWH
jgi:hypothetical protein